MDYDYAGNFWSQTQMSCEFQKSQCLFFLVPLCNNKGFLIFKCELPSKQVEENIHAALHARGRAFINGKKTQCIQVHLEWLTLKWFM